MALPFLDALFAGETRESNLRVKNAADNAARQLLREPESVPLHRLLAQEWWRLARHVVLRRIPPGDASTFPFTAEERLLLDHGWLGEEFAPGGLRAADLARVSLDRAAGPGCPLRVVSLTGYLEARLALFIACRGQDKKTRRIAEIREEIARHWMRILLSGREREALLQTAVDDAEAHAKFRTIEERFQETCVAFHDLRLALGRGQIANPAHRQNYIAVEAALARLREERDAFYRWHRITSGPLQRALRDRDDETEERLRKSRELAFEEARLRAEIASAAAEAVSLPVERKEAFLDEQLRALQNLAAIEAKRAKAEARPWYAGSSHAQLPDRVAALLQAAVAADPDLFQNCRTRHLESPWVILLPAVGEAFYDGDANTFVLPLHGDRSGGVPLHGALGQYRIAMDDTGRILQSFRNLTVNIGLSEQQMVARFAASYAAHIGGGGEPTDEEARWLDAYLRRGASRRTDGSPEATFAGIAADIARKVRLACPGGESGPEVEIAPSSERPGMIDLAVRGADPAGDDLLHLLEALLAQVRLKKFRALVGKD